MWCRNAAHTGHSAQLCTSKSLCHARNLLNGCGIMPSLAGSLGGVHIAGTHPAWQGFWGGVEPGASKSWFWGLKVAGWLCNGAVAVYWGLPDTDVLDTTLY